MVVLEVLAAAMIGIVVGAVLGTIGANCLVDALDSNLIHLVREIDTSTYLLAADAVVIAALFVLVVGLVTDRTPTEPRSSTE